MLSSAVDLELKQKQHILKLFLCLNSDTHMHKSNTLEMFANYRSENTLLHISFIISVPSHLTNLQLMLSSWKWLLHLYYWHSSFINCLSQNNSQIQNKGVKPGTAKLHTEH